MIRLPGMGGAPKPVSRIIFDKYDTDGSGSISASELQNLCYEYGQFITPEQLEIAIMTLDSSGDRQIGYDEFLQWWKSDDRFGQLLLDDEALARRQNAAHLFKQHDTDMSGVIDRNEFVGLWGSLRELGLTNYDADTCLQDIDANADGRIQFNEFIAWLDRHPTAAL